MNIDKIIKELRLQKEMTQEKLAELLGVTMQSVSRWETGICYPDITLLPIIANIFNVTTDKLLGYENERDKKIESILDKVKAFGIKGRSDDSWIDECLNIIRCGLVEFPQNEKLMMCLADTLYEAGYRKYGEYCFYDEKGYLQNKVETHKTNTYWNESIKLCETLMGTSNDKEIYSRATFILVDLNNLLGNNEKAIMFANRMPELKFSKEVLLTQASRGKEYNEYNKELLFKISELFIEQIMFDFMHNKNSINLKDVTTKLKNAINIFNIVDQNEDFGIYNSILISAYLYLSRIEYELELTDDAFVSLYKALHYAKKYEIITGDYDIAKGLSSDWPWWQFPDYTEVSKKKKMILDGLSGLKIQKNDRFELM